MAASHAAIALNAAFRLPVQGLIALLADGKLSGLPRRNLRGIIGEERANIAPPMRLPADCFKAGEIMKVSTTFKAAGLVACTMLFACSPQQNNKNRNETTEMMRGGRVKIGRVCRADIRQYCSSAEKGRGRRQCLESNFDKLSSDCKTALEQRKKNRGGRFRGMNNNNNNRNINNNNGSNSNNSDDND